MLVADLIQAVRELIPDPAPLITAVPSQAISVVSATGSTLPAGTYAGVITQTTAAGETLQSTEQTGLVVGANQGIRAQTTPLQGASGMRLYLTQAGGASGTEQQWWSLSFNSSTGSTATLTVSTPGTLGIPPVRSTAYIPDQDGQAFSAGTLFRWMTMGLREASQSCGGMPNYSGIASVQGQPMYVAQGEWVKVTEFWYDGWPMNLEGPSGFFKRNKVTSSVLSGASVSLLSNQVNFEVWPQPARTSGNTTLTSAAAPTDTSINVASTANFVLPFGLVQIGTEVAAYATLAGTSLTGLVRGLGGQLAQAWPSGTTVNELNIAFRGSMVVNTQFLPGNANTVLQLPSGWDAMLTHYMLARARQAEGDAQAAQQAYQLYQSQLQMWARTNRQLAGPQQIVPRGGDFTVFGGTQFGRFILP